MLINLLITRQTVDNPAFNGRNFFLRPPSFAFPTIFPTHPILKGAGG